jgi:hypothetical protein
MKARPLHWAMSFFGSGNKVYKFVQYSEEAAATDGVAGEVCYYVADTGYAASEVTSDLSASSEIGAGVLVSAMSEGEYGWIQIKGGATLTIALTAGGDGDPLTPTGSADGTLDVSGAVTDHVCAIAVDASANEIICDFPY